eukprot:CAMPEP_0182948382 /NCGR_PEP_ID=MMETSP0105_2-20130417/59730_1 /TAXON_ID=81532 ORGANISM="Acanthoeca-like sp., Strain 10tr" /NCGR_SAMPLE_ID=MMETSP0105_2 /ASSEMBLY_ACC=CAM_ASM_000205 /LENGTH=450 /DNA_ID=CAMNT_0025088673 /DNA_START=98 /DNA_END=1450 /DNA_ORIENTATION=+
MRKACTSLLTAVMIAHQCRVAESETTSCRDNADASICTSFIDSCGHPAVQVSCAFTCGMCGGTTSRGPDRVPTTETTAQPAQTTAGAAVCLDLSPEQECESESGCAWDDQLSRCVENATTTTSTTTTTGHHPPTTVAPNTVAPNSPPANSPSPPSSPTAQPTMPPTNSQASGCEEIFSATDCEESGCLWDAISVSCSEVPTFTQPAAQTTAGALVCIDLSEQECDGESGCAWDDQLLRCIETATAITTTTTTTGHHLATTVAPTSQPTTVAPPPPSPALCSGVPDPIFCDSLSCDFFAGPCPAKCGCASPTPAPTRNCLSGENDPAACADLSCDDFLDACPQKCACSGALSGSSSGGGTTTTSSSSSSTDSTTVVIVLAVVCGVAIATTFVVLAMYMKRRVQNTEDAQLTGSDGVTDSEDESKTPDFTAVNIVYTGDTQQANRVRRISHV